MDLRDTPIITVNLGTNVILGTNLIFKIRIGDLGQGFIKSFLSTGQQYFKIYHLSRIWG